MAAILAFDFGEKHIGVAVGDTEIGLAHPVTTLHVESNVDRLSAVEVLVKEWQPKQFVIGQPRHENGSPHEIAHLAKKFGNRLTEKFRVPVVYVDETLSSDAASRQLREQGVAGKDQKAQIDQVAAQIILQSWFDEKHVHVTA